MGHRHAIIHQYITVSLMRTVVIQIQKAYYIAERKSEGEREGGRGTKGKVHEQSHA